ncbi:MAG TPA: DUF6624 domain-containing protein [Edaphobacter sp.]|jgi:hypothetical protein|nr:DUF6624 domain-containing protein [Edaphobacter sp.]
MLREALFALVAFTAVSPYVAQVASAQAVESKPTPAWEIALQARHNELIQKNGAGTDTALRDQLLRMGAEDQAARGFEHGKQVSGMTKEMLQKLAPTDIRLTGELQQIVQKNGWPTIALVGIDASNAAMLVLTHTADHEWQRQLLPQLQSLADADKIDGSSLALVVDKELVAEGKMQRYGSQFKFINGAMAMFAVEDPGGLDQRRAKALLPPLAIYKQMLSDMYHLKTTDDVVMATAPAKK